MKAEIDAFTLQADMVCLSQACERARFRRRAHLFVIAKKAPRTLRPMDALRCRFGSRGEALSCPYKQRKGRPVAVVAPACRRNPSLYPALTQMAPARRKLSMLASSRPAACSSDSV